MSELPSRLEGHRFHLHFIGEPVARPTSPDPRWRYQFCVRCGSCLNIITEHQTDPVQPGSVYAYIAGPKYNGAQPVSLDVLAYGDLCHRRTDGEDTDTNKPGESVIPSGSLSQDEGETSA